ncbi:MAG: phosphoribosyltransferase [Crenarchaeota archaeon]|nr:phosphoribosyltransferase [Thermoproteota archaeon]
MVLDTDYDVPSWSQIYRLLLRQAKQIRISGFSPEIIIGICRGGWIPARILSDVLNNSNLANLRVESYNGIENATKPILTQPVSVEVKNKKVLVVDEVADSGKTLQLIIKYLQEQGASEIKIACLYYKPNCTIKPDFFEKKTDNWIIFPWELREVLQEIYLQNKNNIVVLQKQIEKLTIAGVSKIFIKMFLNSQIEL